MRTYCRAYAELSSCKPPGFSGSGPLPWWAIKDWLLDAEIRQRDPALAAYMTTVLRMVDGEYMRRQAAENKKPPPKNP